MQEDLNYYEALGVSRNANAETIKQAFRKLAREYHPDKVANLGKEFHDLAVQKMEYINEAYTVLSDPAGRAEYDKMLRTGSSTWFRKSPRKKAPEPPRPDKHISTRERAHAQMMIDSSLFQMRDNIKQEISLPWEDVRLADFVCALAARTFSRRYYVYFKSDYTLSPRSFTAFLQKVRQIDQETRTGFKGKDSMFVLAFAEMEDGIKVEGLWKKFNEESLSAKKNRKYVTLINTAISKVFPPPVHMKDKRLQEIAGKLRLAR